MSEDALIAGLVSVVIPAFNAEATLEATLRSVLTQTYAQLEVLVVDDGSTDGTLALAKDLAAQDNRIRVFSQHNAGVATARNTALAQARGALIAWLDADDLWHPRKLERQLAALAQTPRRPAFVYCGYRLIDETDRVIPGHRPLSDLSGDSLCTQIATNFFSNISSLLTETRFVRQIGGHDPRLRAWGMEGAEDLWMQLQLMQFGPALCCPHVLVGYRMHGSNMSHGMARAARSNLKVMELTQKARPDVPGWVFDLGRARVLGFVPLLALSGQGRQAAALCWTIAIGQPRAALAMLGALLRHGLRHGKTSGGPKDPALGAIFSEADPESGIWQEPLLLGKRCAAGLAEADRILAHSLATPLTHDPFPEPSQDHSCHRRA